MKNFSTTTADTVEMALMDAAITMKRIDEIENTELPIAVVDDAEWEREIREELATLKEVAAYELENFIEAKSDFNDELVFSAIVNGLKDAFQFNAYNFVDSVVNAA